MTATLDLDGMLRRLHLPTVRRLYLEHETRAERDNLSYREYLTLLVAEEVAHRSQTRIQRAVRRARFPFLKTIEEFDWTFQRSIEPRLIGSYLGPELVTEGRGVVFCGPTGTGKTSLSIAVAYRAIQNGFEALFTTANELIHVLSNASRAGRLAQALHAFTHTDVLVIDEVGYLVHPPDAANVMFQVVNERYLKHRPMILTTNKPVDAWGQVLHDPDLAEAILDRVLERGRVIHLRGPSYRTRHLTPAAGGPQPQGDRTPIEGFPTKVRGPQPAPPPPGPGPGERGRRSAHAGPTGSIISGKVGPEYLEPTRAMARALNVKAFRAWVRDLGEFARYYGGLTADVMSEKFFCRDAEARAFLESLGLSPLPAEPAAPIRSCAVPQGLSDRALESLIDACTIRFFEVVEAPIAGVDAPAAIESMKFGPLEREHGE